MHDARHNEMHQKIDQTEREREEKKWFLFIIKQAL